MPMLTEARKAMAMAITRAIPPRFPDRPGRARRWIPGPRGRYGRASRGASARWAWVLAAMAISVVAAFTLVRYGATLAFFPVIAAPCALFVVGQRSNGATLGVAVLVLIPYWYGVGVDEASPVRIVFVLALAGLIVERGVRWQPSWVDVPVVALMLGAIVTWRGDLGLPGRLLVQDLVALGLYFLVRATVDASNADRLVAVFVFASGLASLTVLYEFFVAGHPLFVDST